MKPFRSVIAELNDSTFCPKVIGYRQLFVNEVHVPAGTEDFFLFLLPRDSWCYCRGSKTLLDRSALILIAPGTGIRHGKERAMIRSWIRFTGHEAGSLCQINGIEANRLYPTENPEEHEDHLISLYRELHHPKGALPFNVKSLFANWLRSIIRDTAPQSDGMDRRLFLAREYLEQSFTQKCELGDVCRHSGLSRNDLCRLFKSAYGTSPMQYLISLRISLAKELLLNSRLPLKAIGEQCGFRDPYYFSRCFKKHAGITPGRYRDTPASAS